MGDGGQGCSKLLDFGRTKAQRTSGSWPRVKLPPPLQEEIVATYLAGPVEHISQAPHVEGPHRRV
eukprot:6145734-Amphidinium_carterae.1